MMMVAALLCVVLVGLTLYALNRFARYTWRRAALADPPGVWFGPGSNRWLAILLVVGWLGLMACLVACLCVLIIVGGFAP